FDENSAGLGVDGASGRVQVAVGDVGEPCEQRLKPLMILRLSRGAERAKRSAMEAVHHRDDLVAARFARQPGELDGCLHGFGAAIAKEALAFPAAAFT